MEHYLSPQISFSKSILVELKHCTEHLKQSEKEITIFRFLVTTELALLSARSSDPKKICSVVLLKSHKTYLLVYNNITWICVSLQWHVQLSTPTWQRPQFEEQKLQAEKKGTMVKEISIPPSLHISSIAERGV